MVRVVLVLALVGCGGKTEPSCEDAVEHIAELSKNSVNRSERAIAACKQVWSVEMRRCIMAATTDDGFVACTREHVDVGQLKKVRDELKSKGTEALRKQIREHGAGALSGSDMKALDTGSGARRVDTGSDPAP
jgi:hypothetical protein